MPTHFFVQNFGFWQASKNEKLEKVPNYYSCVIGSKNVNKSKHLKFIIKPQKLYKKEPMKIVFNNVRKFLPEPYYLQKIILQENQGVTRTNVAVEKIKLFIFDWLLSRMLIFIYTFLILHYNLHAHNAIVKG